MVKRAEPIGDDGLTIVRTAIESGGIDTQILSATVKGMLARLDAAEAENKRFRTTLKQIVEIYNAGLEIPSPVLEHDVSTIAAIANAVLEEK